MPRVSINIKAKDISRIIPLMRIGLNPEEYVPITDAEVIDYLEKLLKYYLIGCVREVESARKQEEALAKVTHEPIDFD